MNRLRGRKKAKDDLATPSRPSIESESSGPFRMFGRTKKADEPLKKDDLDLTTALPPSDDFRTSLLMTGLSARFSMLREQDDPTSMLGKASDDSVLYPKRQSRIDFGLGIGLDDIAEVGSMRTPPFARKDSYQSADDSASVTGSIMGRGKQTEGNNLFGGRQKVYKISATSTSKAGGLPGRAVYEDDVSLSAFQKWRQAEKERKSSEEDHEPHDSHEFDSANPTSPMHDFSKRRETSSTTSSVPSFARNSTAATSVTSTQPAQSFNDWQSSGAASTASTPAPMPERSVTRTRRLYEQGLTQDLHEQQSSALSRIDTLSRSRLGNRTPDLTPSVSSPTGATMERINERRPIVSKASAPNMRSFSPHGIKTTQPSPADSSYRFTKPDPKHTSPPLSPPVSETEEYPTLSIQPNDRGKATALGFFTRPAQQYDETQFAQRQMQLQHGRETPSSRHRAESNASGPGDGSRSSSLARPAYDRSGSAAMKTEPTVEEKSIRTTFLDMTDEASAAETSEATQRSSLHINLERPDDEQHPAFRRSALPTPLSISSRTSEEDPLPSAKDSLKEEPAQDSPTLGPTSGLSGMVRQHLRNVSTVSTASSLYGAANHEYDHPSFTSTHDNVATNLIVNDWDNPHADTSPIGERIAEERQFSSPPQPATADAGKGHEHEEFARHLADGARRVREKLTSYVESDQSHTTSPTLPAADVNQEWAAPRLGAFSLLRTKSSTGSLADRDRNASDASQPRTRKPVASPNTMTSQPPPPVTFDNSQGYAGGMDQGTPSTVEEESPQADKDENIHAGLKAFRQARRELQRMKEKEVQQRYQPPSQTAPAPASTQVPAQQMPILQPVAYNPASAHGDDVSDPKSRGGSRAGSRTGYSRSSERDRSGSEASTGGQPAPRPRYRAPSSARDDSQRSFSPVSSSAVGGSYYGSAASPAAGDFKRSPMMPSYPSRREHSPGPYSRPGSATGHRLPSASTPHLGSSPSAPPLPPINPRRKQMAGDLVPPPRVGSSAPTSPYLPMSPDKLPTLRRPLVMSDEEGDPSQFRSRLRRVPNETSEYAPPGSHGRPFPRDGPPNHGGAQMPPPRSNGPHGMI